MPFSTRVLGFWAFFYVSAVFLLTPVPGLSRLTFLGLAGLAASLLLRGADLRFLRALDLPVLLAAAFAILAVGSVLWAENVLGAGVNAASTLTGLVGAILLYTALQNGMSYAWIAWGAVFGGAVEGVAAVREMLSGAVVRAEGLTGNANLLGFLLSVAGLLILAWPARPRFLTWVALAYIVTATLTSGSRTVLLVWVGLLLLAVWHLRALSWRRRGFLLLGAAVATSIGALAVARSATVQLAVEGFYLLRRLQNLGWGGDASIMYRVDMIREAAVLWPQAPVLGHGIGQYRYISGWDTYSHNNYLELLVGLGIVGFLLYVGQHGVLLYRGFQGDHLSRGRYQFVVAGTLVLLLWDVGTVSYAHKYTWLLLSVLWFQARRTAVLTSADAPAAEPVLARG